MNEWGPVRQWQTEQWVNSGWIENSSDWESDGLGDDYKHIA